MSRLAPRTRVCSVLVVGLLALSGSPVVAQTSGDRVGAVECCQELLFFIGARAVGLGNALTARPGVDAMFVNPAALESLAGTEFRVHNAPTDIEMSNTFSISFGIRDAGKFSLSYRLIDFGEIEARDEQGFPTGTIKLYDQMLVASFATSMAPGLSAGVSYKLFQFRQDCSGACGEPGFSATTHAVDAGVQYHPRLWPALQLGASVVNLGLALQVINAEQASPMPTRIRAGAAYEVMHHFSTDTTTAVWASLDVSGSLREGTEQIVNAGLELVLDRTIFVRSGYSTGSGRSAGFGVGIGLRYDRFDVGIGKTFISASTGDRDPFQVTFAVGF